MNQRIFWVWYFYFKINKNGECNRQYNIDILRTIKEIGDKSTPIYSTSSMDKSINKEDGRETSSSINLTLIKKPEVYKGSNGNNLNYKLIAMILILKILKTMAQQML